MFYWVIMKWLHTDMPDVLLVVPEVFSDHHGFLEDPEIRTCLHMAGPNTKGMTCHRSPSDWLLPEKVSLSGAGCCPGTRTMPRVSARPRKTWTNRRNLQRAGGTVYPGKKPPKSLSATEQHNNFFGKPLCLIPPPYW